MYFSASQTPSPGPKEEEPIVIGKLKKINFSELSPNKRRLNVDRIPRTEFSSPCLKTFQEKLKDSLDVFVVRREIVISDVQTFSKAATSVTFTRKSCFRLGHTHDNNTV